MAIPCECDKQGDFEHEPPKIEQHCNGQTEFAVDTGKIGATKCPGKLQLVEPGESNVDGIIGNCPLTVHLPKAARASTTRLMRVRLKDIMRIINEGGQAIRYCYTGMSLPPLTESIIQFSFTYFTCLLFYCSYRYILLFSSRSL